MNFNQIQCPSEFLSHMAGFEQTPQHLVHPGFFADITPIFRLPLRGQTIGLKLLRLGVILWYYFNIKIIILK